MCGRFNQMLTPRQWKEIYHVLSMSGEEYAASRLRYNTAPMQQVAVIRDSSGEPELSLMQWKLVPSWSKTRTTKFHTINARVETIATSNSYRGPFRRRRCLVPAAGFYEWPRSSSSHFDEKKPYYILLPEDRPMVFAGIWDRWERDGDLLESCSIVTIPANDMMAEFHDRMPAIPAPETWSLWLDHDVEDESLLLELLQRQSAPSLQKYRIGSAVNNWRTESPDVLQPDDP